jgi:hypothetical protein
MESPHKLKMALIKIRLMADISQSSQCKNEEYALLMEMISDMADNVICEEKPASLPFSVYDDDEE